MAYYVAADLSLADIWHLVVWLVVPSCFKGL